MNVSTNLKCICQASGLSGLPKIHVNGLTHAIPTRVSKSSWPFLPMKNYKQTILLCVYNEHINFFV